MPKNFRALACTLAVACIVGCSTMKVGRNFDYGAFASKVQPGVTTSTQVAEWLGAPVGKGTEVNPDGSRLDVWTYYYGSGKIPSGSDTNFKMLQVKLDQQGKVTGYVWSGELAGAPVDDKSAKK